MYTSTEGFLNKLKHNDDVSQVFQRWADKLLSTSCPGQEKKKKKMTGMCCRYLGNTCRSVDVKQITLFEDMSHGSGTKIRNSGQVRGGLNDLRPAEEPKLFILSFLSPITRYEGTTGMELAK